MELKDFTTYVTAAEELAIQNPLGYKRLAFVSSEDPQVIEDAITLKLQDTGAPWNHIWRMRPEVLLIPRNLYKWIEYVGKMSLLVDLATTAAGNERVCAALNDNISAYSSVGK